ncbi:MAG: hypothetical protein HOE90_01830 [Bacteriovoracaceae bacterium]|nr:hypothetical protein [Bacteriovoracaceae bacterium]
MDQNNLSVDIDLRTRAITEFAYIYSIYRIDKIPTEVESINSDLDKVYQRIDSFLKNDKEEIESVIVLSELEEIYKKIKNNPIDDETIIRALVLTLSCYLSSEECGKLLTTSSEISSLGGPIEASRKKLEKIPRYSSATKLRHLAKNVDKEKLQHRAPNMGLQNYEFIFFILSTHLFSENQSFDQTEAIKHARDVLDFFERNYKSLTYFKK